MSTDMAPIARHASLPCGNVRSKPGGHAVTSRLHHRPHRSRAGVCAAAPRASSREPRRRGSGLRRSNSEPSGSRSEPHGTSSGQLRSVPHRDQSGSDLLRRGFLLFASRSEVQQSSPDCCRPRAVPKGSCSDLARRGPILLANGSRLQRSRRGLLPIACRALLTRCELHRRGCFLFPSRLEPTSRGTHPRYGRCNVRTTRTRPRARAAPTPAGTSCGSARRHRAPSLRLRCRRHARR